MESVAHRTNHPYYPRDLVLDHYVANTNSVLKTLSHVFVAFATIVLLTAALAYRIRHSALSSRADQLTFFWFMLCGLIHIMFEGYFGLYHATLAGNQSTVVQAWKEYALSDSRYLSSDTFVLVTERITTLVWGPLALYSAWSLHHDLPSRHIAQLILSVGHIYGCLLYYWTSIFEGSPQCDPHPYYYYFYFWFFNIAWMIAPVFLMRSSIKTLRHAMALVEQLSKTWKS